MCLHRPGLRPQHITPTPTILSEHININIWFCKHTALPLFILKYQWLCTASSTHTLGLGNLFNKPYPCWWKSITAPVAHIHIRVSPFVFIIKQEQPLIWNSFLFSPPPTATPCREWTFPRFWRQVSSSAVLYVARQTPRLPRRKRGHSDVHLSREQTIIGFSPQSAPAIIAAFRYVPFALVSDVQCHIIQSISNVGFFQSLFQLLQFNTCNYLSYYLNHSGLCTLHTALVDNIW